MRQPLVVRVKKGEPRVSGPGDPRVSGRAHAPVDLVANAFRAGSLADMGRVLGRAVIDHENLRGRPGALAKRAGDRAPDSVSAVVRGDDDGDRERLVGHTGHRTNRRRAPPSPARTFFLLASVWEPA